MSKSFRGWMIIILCSSIPVVLWFTQPDAADRIGDSTSILTSLGQISSLVGVVLFSLSLVLSLRIRLLEEYFDGMNSVYQAHHIVGGLAFIALLVHPLFLIIPYSAGSWREAALFLLPGQDWTINIGIAALLSMMSLLGITYYLDLPYQLWRYTHKFLGAVFFLGAMHGFFVESDVSRYVPLWWSMIVFSLLGAIAFIYRTLLGKILVPRYHYTIERVIHDTGKVIELVMKPSNPKRHMRFYPGQFIFLTIDRPSIDDTDPHPFSISSSPQQDSMRISIKALGDFSSWVGGLTQGMTATLEGPFGRFSYLYNPNTSYVWIAGGIGVTPFVSMAYTLTGTISVDLYYCMSDPSESAHLAELQTLAAVTQHFRVIPWYSGERGRLTGQQIVQTSGSIAQKDIFICGPGGMMHALKKQLRACGAHSSQIHTEEFDMV